MPNMVPSREVIKWRGEEFDDVGNAIEFMNKLANNGIPIAHIKMGPGASGAVCVCYYGRHIDVKD